jgi:anti-sigma regulatory factor (Ser/Thr protein kinase)
MSTPAGSVPAEQGFHHEALFYASEDEYLAGLVPFITEGLDVGEPIWKGRSDDELVECSRHESLLNLAFADAAGFRLLCPYDTASLAAVVLDEARCNHPHVGRPGESGTSEAYRPDVPPWLDSPLPGIPPDAHVRTFGSDELGEIRRLAAEIATTAGVAPERIDDLVIAVSEVVTNTVLHGGGTGQIALWHDGDRYLCDVRDRGRISDPLAGRVRPSIDRPGGRGLWIMNQLCDLVQVRATPDGQAIRLHLAC